jgi:hypothetical protein
VGFLDFLFVPVERGVVEVDDCVAAEEVAQHALLPLVDVVIYFLQQRVDVLLVLHVIVNGIGGLLYFIKWVPPRT